MENKIFYTHGIYKYDPLLEKNDLFVRNTNKEGRDKKLIPLPLKLQHALWKKWKEWFHISKWIKWFDITAKVEGYIDGKIEFTIAECPEQHITVIVICHPFIKEDHFQRKEGIRRARMRMEWALKNPDKKERWWLYRLER